MTSLEAALVEINVTLNRLHVSFALVGGLAVSVRTDGPLERLDLDPGLQFHAERLLGHRLRDLHNAEESGENAEQRDLVERKRRGIRDDSGHRVLAAAISDASSSGLIWM